MASDVDTINQTPALANRRLTRLCLWGYLISGLIAVVFAPVFPLMIQEFQLSLSLAGLMFPARAVGNLLGGMIAGPLSDRHGPRPLVLISVFMLAFGLLFTAISPTWPVVLVSFALTGLAQSALSALLNTLAADANPDRRAKALGNLHGLYGVGALIAPLIIAVAMDRAVSWRWMFAVPGLLWILFAIPALRAPYPGSRSQQTSSNSRRRLFDPVIFKQEILLLLFFVAFAYNGIAWSLLGWVKTYLDEATSLPAFLSTSMISLFYLALTAGRFGCGHLAERIGAPRTILLCAAGTTLCYPVVIFGQGPLSIAIGVFLCGLALSGLYPTAIAFGNTRFPEIAGTVTGSLSTAMTLGTMLPPWWTGAIAEQFGFQTGMAFNLTLVLGLLLVALRLLRRSEPIVERQSSTASTPRA